MRYVPVMALFFLNYPESFILRTYNRPIVAHMKMLKMGLKEHTLFTDTLEELKAVLI